MICQLKSTSCSLPLGTLLSSCFQYSHQECKFGQCSLRHSVFHRHKPNLGGSQRPNIRFQLSAGGKYWQQVAIWGLSIPDPILLIQCVIICLDLLKDIMYFIFPQWKIYSGGTPCFPASILAVFWSNEAPHFFLVGGHLCTVPWLPANWRRGRQDIGRWGYQGSFFIGKPRVWGSHLDFRILLRWDSKMKIKNRRMCPEGCVSFLPFLEFSN